MRKNVSVLVLPAVGNIKDSIESLSAVSVTGGKFHQISIIFKDARPTILFDGGLIEDFDMVWLSSFWRSRSIAYTIKQYLDAQNVPSSWVEKSSSKISDQMTFCLAGIPLPKTFFCPAKNALVFIDELESVCGYPFVIKDNRGARGMDSLLVSSREEFLSVWDTLPKHKMYHMQEFVPNDYDWGILVVNGKVISGEKSYHSSEDFRNNACNGAKEEFVPVERIPNNVKELAILASESLGLTWSRADILVHRDSEELFLLEVNRSPGITKNSDEEVAARMFLEELLA